MKTLIHVRMTFYIIIILTAIGTLAEAMPITFTFHGDVTSVDPVLSGTFATTDKMKVTYTFESTTAADVPSPGPNEEVYFAITAMDIIVGTYTASASSGAILVANDIQFNVIQFDEYIVVVNPLFFPGVFPLTGLPVAGLPIEEFAIGLFDFESTAFNSTGLPATLDLSAFQGTNDIADWDLGFDNKFVGGIITSVSASAPAPAPVPEPTTVALLGIGLVGLAGAEVRRRRKKKAVGNS